MSLDDFLGGKKKPKEGDGGKKKSPKTTTSGPTRSRGKKVTKKVSTVKDEQGDEIDEIGIEDEMIDDPVDDGEGDVENVGIFTRSEDDVNVDLDDVKKDEEKPKESMLKKAGFVKYYLACKSCKYKKIKEKKGELKPRDLLCRKCGSEMKVTRKTA